MDPFTLMLAGSALGLGKGLLEKKQVEKQNIAESEKTRYSALTGRAGNLQASPSALGSTLQGGLAGASLGQSFAAAAPAATATAGTNLAVNYKPMDYFSKMATA